MGICSSKTIPPPSGKKQTQDEEIVLILSHLQSQSQQIQMLAQRFDESPKLKETVETFEISSPGEIETLNWKLSSLNEENETLLRSLHQLEQWRFRSTIRNLSRISKSSSLSKLADSFQAWKDVRDSSLSGIDFMESLEIMNDETFQFVKSITDSNSQSLLVDNILLKEATKGDKPMPRSLLFRLFEDMLDKKYEADNSELFRPVRSFQDFAIEFMNRFYGLKTIAQSHISSMVQGLQELYDAKDAYGMLICRFLHLFDPRPIPLQLATFLTKVRMDFYKIAALYSKESKVKTGRQVAYLLDTMNLVHSLFENDFSTRSSVLRILRPDTLSEEEYLNFRVSHRMLRIGLSSDQLFSLLDENANGFVSEHMLAKGLKKTLDISTSLSVLLAGFPFQKGKLSREGFVSKINTNVFYENSRSVNYTVNMVHFFHVLIDAYEGMQMKDALYLKNFFLIYYNRIDSFEKFYEAMNFLEEGIDTEVVKSIYDQIPEITCEKFVKVAIEYNVGGLGIRDFRRKRAKNYRRVSDLDDSMRHLSTSPTLMSPQISPRGKVRTDSKGTISACLFKAHSLKMSLKSCYD